MHQDSQGHNGLIYPGLAQRMSAGTGILHSEKNDAWRLTGGDEHQDPVHFVQMWVLPDENGIEPGYEQLEIDDELLRGGLVPVASRPAGHQDAAAISISQRHAALLAARLAPAESVALPDAPFVHLFVARGSVELEGSRAAGHRRRAPDHRGRRPARHRRPDGAEVSSGRCTPASRLPPPRACRLRAGAAQLTGAALGAALGLGGRGRVDVAEPVAVDRLAQSPPA